MATKIKLVQGDTRPFIRLTLSDRDGNPINLSDADTVVRVYFREYETTTVLATLTCFKPNGGADGLVVFSFPAGTLDLPAGLYEGEVEISFGSEKQTIYQPLRFVLREQFA
jgi:hypothetical protein